MIKNGKVYQEKKILDLHYSEILDETENNKRHAKKS